MFEASPAAPTTRPIQTLKTPFAIFAIGALVAMIWAFVVFPRVSAIDQWFDVNGTGSIGEHMYMGRGFSMGSGETMRRGPVYPYMALASFKLFGYDESQRKQSYRPLLFFQCLLAGGTCVLVFLTTSRIAGRHTALWSALLCAFYPQCLRYVGTVDVESVMMFFSTLIAYSVVRLSQERTPLNGALCGIAIGLATLTKSVTLLLPVVVAIFLLWRTPRTQRRAALAPIACCVIAFILVCLPWIMRNRIVSNGRFSGISTHAPAEFIRGYVNAQPKYFFFKTPFQANWDVEANQYEAEIFKRFNLEYDYFRTINVETELLKDRIEGQVAKEMLIGDPLGFVKKFLIQCITFWYMVETPSKSILVGSFALVALLLALRGAMVLRKTKADPTPVIMLVLYFNLLYAAILAFARYSMPVFPTLLVLSGVGLASMRNRVPQSSGKA